MAKNKLSSKNIIGIFKEVQKKLDELEVPPIDGGFIFTPYGTIVFRGNKLCGNKKAISWFKKMFYEPRKTKK